MTNLVIISGVSGSGKSTAMNVLEDLGYYCIDNLPMMLLPKFIELCENSQGDINKIALVVDIREGVFFKGAPEVIKDLKEKGHPIDVIFLDSSDTALVRRYKETRRKHPLSVNGNILEGISKEREMLKDLKELSSYSIDTSDFNVHELKELIKSKFDKSHSQKLLVNILSFGYKHGHPYDADMVFDVRFLPNPFFVEELKELNGLDDEIVEFVLSKEVTKEYFKKLTEFLEFLIPRYEKEGKSYLTIAVGCTGGKHRSVVITKKLSEHFKHLSPVTIHRDISKS
ncbi:MAG: RNase adaptor protein RapZ [Candidatus Dadabacteria bacterium RIFCSPHIGHO2_12_FULL_53_21]|nr:MAG: RNase adaptor protein RapZ [Candidatus Dadabacteria bacterium RIFCSPHIGHO2_12_FULL_53_21]